MGVLGDREAKREHFQLRFGVLKYNHTDQNIFKYYGQKRYLLDEKIYNNWHTYNKGDCSLGGAFIEYKQPKTYFHT